MTRELPPFLIELLNTPPRAGEGVHVWLFRVCRQLHAHLPAGEILSLLKSSVAHCGRHVSDAEILDAIKNSLASAWQPRGTSAPVQSAKKWPGLNKEQREAIVRDNGGLADLWEASRIRIDDNGQHTEEIIDALFPGNPLLCAGKSMSDFDTRPREDWRGEMSKLQLIVPSPMTARLSLNRDSGTASAKGGFLVQLQPSI